MAKEAGGVLSNGQKIQNGRWQGRRLQDGGSGKSSGAYPQRKAGLEFKGGEILRDFVWANKDLLDKKVSEEFFAGNKQAVTEALNQIHWRSLKLRGGFEWKDKTKIELVDAFGKEN